MGILKHSSETHTCERALQLMANAPQHMLFSAACSRPRCRSPETGTNKRLLEEMPRYLPAYSSQPVLSERAKSQQVFKQLWMKHKSQHGQPMTYMQQDVQIPWLGG